MLQADLVEYNLNVTVNGNQSLGLTNGSAKAVEAINSDTRDGHIAYGTSKDGYIQFAEQYFNKLVLTKNGDDFGRPANTWTYKGVEIGTYADDANVTYYKDVKLNAIYSDLAMVDEAASTTVYINGVRAYRATSTINSDFNVARTHDKKLSKIDDADEATSIVAGPSGGTVGAGTITEVFLDTDTNAVTICIMSLYAGKISEVKDATAKRDDYVVVTVGNGDKLNLNTTNTNNTYETTDFAEDDVVAFTYANNKIQTMYKMESVEGKLDKRVVEKSVQIDGTVIPYGKEYDFDTNLNEEALTNGSSYVVYKDDQGNALWIEESAFSLDQYAWVDNITSTGDGLQANRARLILADGTKKTVELDKNYTAAPYNITGETTNGVANGTATLVKFSQNSSGDYKLTAVTGSNLATFADLTISTNKTVSEAGTASTLDFDANTVFVVRQMKYDTTTNSWVVDKIKTYTGIKNAPVINDTNTTATGVALIRNTTNVKAIFIDKAEAINSSNNVTFVAGASVTKLYKSTTDDTEYYVYNAVVDGEVTSIAVEKNVTINDGVSGLSLAAGDKKSSDNATKGVIFNTSASNDDDIITSASYSNTNGVNSYVDVNVKRVSSTQVKINGSLKDLSSSCNVYEITDGGDITKIETSEITTSPAARVIYTVDDGYVTNLFIMLPAET
jgi:hypothetical protein